MAEAKQYLWEIDPATITESVVLVDIDGTIAVADAGDVHPAVHGTLTALRETNHVLLFSNNPNRDRLMYMSQTLGVPAVSSRRRKPNPRILRDMPTDRPLVVIGDKMLTDGLFAHFTRARFIEVRRVRGPEESYVTRLLYWLDDACSPFVNLMRLWT